MFGPDVRDARRNEFPFVVSIAHKRIENNVIVFTHSCTGVLVTRQDVLSVAHCIQDQNWNNMVVLIGSNNYNNGRQHQILWWITFNDFAHRLQIEPQFNINDIGNIRVNNLS
jgi:secreted trypsin-like serine protease